MAVAEKLHGESLSAWLQEGRQRRARFQRTPAYQGEWPDLRQKSGRRIVHVMLSERPWGIAQVVMALTKAQVREHEVWVAANSDLVPRLGLHPDVRLLSLPIEFGRRWPTTATMLRSLRSYMAAARLLESVSPSVLHFHLPSALAIALVSKSATPRVYTIHGEFFENRLLQKLQSISMPVIIRGAPATTISKYAISPSWLLGSVRVIPNGIDQSLVDSRVKEDEPLLSKLVALRARGRGPLIVFPGILIARKGQEFALRAMRLLRRKMPEALLVFIGEGPDKSKLVQLSKDLGVEGNVLFLGYAGNQYPLIQYADLILSHLTDEWPLPSLVELEALTLGKPVVTLYTDEKGSLYGDHVGYIRSNDESELSDQICRGLEQREAAAMVHEFIHERFDWERISKEYELVYSAAGRPR